MFSITLKNNKTFVCDEITTIFEAAKANGIALEHSCLTARCRSCLVKIIEGTTKDKLDDLVLSMDEKEKNYTLSCNAIPTSDISMDVEDMGNVILYDKKIVPAKIQSIKKLTDDVIKVSLRLPPNANLKYNSGQYVNLIKGNLKRSYSVANAFKEKTSLEFFIKKYEKGLMSQYWFEEAKENDLLRMEGPLGSFFLRESNYENIIFLATGTGIAPIKAILENIQKSSYDFIDKKFFVFVGARYKEDLFWEPDIHKGITIKYIPVLSRQKEDWSGEKGYVQDAVLKYPIDLEHSQVYACGSNEMIQSAKEVIIKNKLSENNFFSDAFVETN
jgi:CDP-4-dehydro-6-deoxyglucose reductase